MRTRTSHGTPLGAGTLGTVVGLAVTALCVLLWVSLIGEVPPWT